MWLNKVIPHIENIIIHRNYLEKNFFLGEKQLQQSNCPNERGTVSSG